jgi:hypothetical protein
MQGKSPPPWEAQPHPPGTTAQKGDGAHESLHLNRAIPIAYTGRSQSPRKTEFERNLEQYLEQNLNRASTVLTQNEYMAYTNLIPSSGQAPTEVRTARKQS